MLNILNTRIWGAWLPESNEIVKVKKKKEEWKGFWFALNKWEEKYVEDNGWNKTNWVTMVKQNKHK